MRSLHRAALAFGIMLLGGLSSFVAIAPAQAESTTIEVTDVYNAVTPGEEWFQLYNLSKGSLTLTKWSVCTGSTCVTLPTTTIESFSLAKIKASSLTGWPAKGLDGTSDMVGIKDQDGKPIDSMNWGAPSSTWKNYEAFKGMLWNPGIKVIDASTNQSYFRMAIGKDTDKPTDWLTTASKPAGGPTAVAGPTKTPEPGKITGTTTSPPKAPAKNPQTGGEFPVFLALGLIAAVFLVRYFRRGLTPQRNVR
ncbi:MAG TPA: hypothetical protein VM536_03910 [Chloroflexia bacterium]|nr:hypothetical protein [Chloroflexia bacterium]